MDKHPHACSGSHPSPPQIETQHRSQHLPNAGCFTALRTLTKVPKCRAPGSETVSLSQFKWPIDPSRKLTHPNSRRRLEL